MGQCVAKPSSRDGEVEVLAGVLQQDSKRATPARRDACTGMDDDDLGTGSPKTVSVTPGGSDSALMLQGSPAKPVSLSSAMFAGGQAPRKAEAGTQADQQRDPARRIRAIDSRLNRSANAHACSGIFYTIRRKENVDEYYIIEEKLGHGQFGEVFAGTNKATGKRVAIKSMSKSKAEADPEFLKDIRREVEIMQQLGKHANIVCLYEVFEDAGAIHLILELCEGGNWFQRLIEHGTYSESQAAETIRTLLKTLQYCHSVGVVHRDIKPENILLSDNTEGATLKLADFGLSAIIPTTTSEQPHLNSNMLTDAVGTSYYVAPEVLKSRGYDHRCDIWSLGVVLYIVLGGMAPFDGANEEQILDSVLHSKLSFKDETWDEISSSAKDMIKRMLCRDPRKRASINELLAHPWLKLADIEEDKDIAETEAARAAHNMPELVVARLQQFAAMNRFKKEARRMLAVFLPEDEIMALLEQFKAMDRDGDGVLTLAELHEALNAKGPYLPKEEAQNLLDCVDLNSNGVIDYEEFLAATMHQMHLEKQELMWRAFQNFDHDRCGYISVQELREAFISQGASVDAEIVLRSMGHVGVIDYPAFCKLMEKLEQGSAKRGTGVSQARLLLTTLSSRVRASQLKQPLGPPRPGQSARSEFMSLLGSLASSKVTEAARGSGTGGALSSGKSGRIRAVAAEAEASEGVLSVVDSSERPGRGLGNGMPSNASSAATHSSFYAPPSPTPGLYAQSPQRQPGGGARRGSGGGGADVAAAAAAAVRAVAQDRFEASIAEPYVATHSHASPSRVLMRDASLRDKPMPGVRGGRGKARHADPGGFGPPTVFAHPSSVSGPDSLPPSPPSGAAAAPDAPVSPPGAAAGAVRLSPLSSGYRSMLRQFSIAAQGAGAAAAAAAAATAAVPDHGRAFNLLSSMPEDGTPTDRELDAVVASASSESSLVIQKNEASLDQWGLTKQLGEDRGLYVSETAGHTKSRFAKA